MGFGLGDDVLSKYPICVSRITSTKILPEKRDVKLSGFLFRKGKKLLNTQYSVSKMHPDKKGKERLYLYII